MSLGVERLMPLLTDTLEGAVRRDAAKVKEATDVLWRDGDTADTYGFLCGLLAAAAPKLPPGWHVHPAIVDKQPGGRLRAVHPGQVPQPVLIYAQLFSAHLNMDGDTGCALWAAALQTPGLAGEVMAYAIAQAAGVVRHRRAVLQ